MQEFSVGECVRYGWDTFKKRPWFFIGISLFFAVIGGVSSNIVSNATAQGMTGSGFFLWLVDFFVIQVFISMGQIAFFIKAHDSVETVKLADAWAPHVYLKFLGTYLLTAVIVVGGLILLIVPGIIWGLGLYAATYLTVDKGLKPMEAIRESFRITKGFKWRIALLSLALVGVALLGLLALVVGIFVATPVIFLSMAHAYRTLQAKAGPTPVTA